MLGGLAPRTANAAPAVAAAAATDQGPVILTNVASSRNLDIDGPSRNDGAVLHLWHAYTTDSQK